MPLYDYVCPQCHTEMADVFVAASDTVLCSRCNNPMVRKMVIVHAKVGTSVDNHPVGQVVRQKNDRLKKQWSAYSHQEKQLRREIERRVQK